MRLAGIDIPNTAVLELSKLLHEHGFQNTAIRIEVAVDGKAAELALAVWERKQALRALEDCPEELLQLRASLLADTSAASATGSPDDDERTSRRQSQTDGSDAPAGEHPPSAGGPMIGA